MTQKLGVTTLVGLGVIGMMAYAFIVPKLLSKPKPPVAPEQVPVTSPAVTVGVPNNMDVPPVAAADDMDMNFAGVTFAENIPGLSYGFPMAGVV